MVWTQAPENENGGYLVGRDKNVHVVNNSQYRCDACGIEDCDPSFPGYPEGKLLSIQVTSKEENRYNTIDLCPRCWPEIKIVGDKVLREGLVP